MFDVAPSELLLVAFVALVIIGPKDLPKAMRFVGHWVARARGVARQFRSGFDSMVREAELEEMEKRWADENARIMREHPVATDRADDPATGSPATPPMSDHDDAGVDADHDSGPISVEKPQIVPAAAAAPAADGKAPS